MVRTKRKGKVSKSAKLCWDWRNISDVQGPYRHNVCCPYCGKPAMYELASFIFGKKYKGRYKYLWTCRKCDARTHASNITQAPVGLMANASLRARRSEIDGLLKKLAERKTELDWSRHSSHNYYVEAIVWARQASGVGNKSLSWMDEDECEAMVATIAPWLLKKSKPAKIKEKPATSRLWLRKSNQRWAYHWKLRAEKRRLAEKPLDPTPTESQTPPWLDSLSSF